MIELPKSFNGKPQVSYSQIDLWNSIKGFNTGLPGYYEYVRKYFLNEKYTDYGWGQFGNEVQEYIQERKCPECFNDQEKEVLDKIEVFGEPEVEMIIDFDSFVLLGFKDEESKDKKLIRDYKTASMSSKQKYFKEDYFQLDVYALHTYKELGFIPKIELCIIERGGNAFKGGRKSLTVGTEVWYHTVQTSKDRLKLVENYILETVEEISDYYKIFKKFK